MDRLPAFAVTALKMFADNVMTNEPSQILGTYNDPYLRRWWLTKDRSHGSIYIHEMIRSDQDEELHDHPGDNLSIILSGEMIEHTSHDVRRWQPGDIIARKADFKHRVEIEAPLITMWIMGERLREWGFWEQTPEGEKFIPSQEFFKKRGYF